jgi:hypothetical protein
VIRRSPADTLQWLWAYLPSAHKDRQVRQRNSQSIAIANLSQDYDCPLIVILSGGILLEILIDSCKAIKRVASI